MLGGDLLGRVLPVRAGQRVRRRRDAHQRARGRRSVHDQRHQGVDLARAGRPTSTPSSPALRRSDGRSGPAASAASTSRRRRRASTAASPEHKMGMRGSATAQVRFDDAAGARDQLVGDEGRGFAIALAGAGRRPAGDRRVRDRRRPGRAGRRRRLRARAAPVRPSDHRVPGPVVHARRHGHVGGGRARAVPGGGQAQGRGPAVRPQAAMAKLFASDTAMKVTTDAVQVLGGYGYVEDFPAERLMREAKALQIVEGTNQIQRMVIGRSLARHRRPGGAGPEWRPATERDGQWQSRSPPFTAAPRAGPCEWKRPTARSSRCWPRRPAELHRLARQTGLSVSAVQQRVRRLEARGDPGLWRPVDPDGGLPLTASCPSSLSIRPRPMTRPRGWPTCRRSRHVTAWRGRRTTS